jgi:hypothetical protein
MNVAAVMGLDGIGAEATSPDLIWPRICQGGHA